MRGRRGGFPLLTARGSHDPVAVLREQVAGFEPAISSLARKRSSPLCYTCTKRRVEESNPWALNPPRFSGPLAGHSAALSRVGDAGIEPARYPVSETGSAPCARSPMMRPAGLEPARPIRTPAPQAGASAVSPRARAKVDQGGDPHQAPSTSATADATAEPIRAPCASRTRCLSLTKGVHILMCFESVVASCFTMLHGDRRNRTHHSRFWSPLRPLA